jgi:CRISPR-associated protein Csa3
VARRLGIDSSTAYRHLEDLVEKGLVKVEKGRAKAYKTDNVVRLLAKLLLQVNAKH